MRSSFKQQSGSDVVSVEAQGERQLVVDVPRLREPGEVDRTPRTETYRRNPVVH